MTMQCNTVSANDSARSRSKSLTASVHPSTAEPQPVITRVTAVYAARQEIENDEPKQNAAKKKKQLVCRKCGGKSHPARLCPSADDCHDVDEVGAEPSSDADSDLFGLDWGVMILLRASVP